MKNPIKPERLTFSSWMMLFVIAIVSIVYSIFLYTYIFPQLNQETVFTKRWEHYKLLQLAIYTANQPNLPAFDEMQYVINVMANDHHLLHLTLSQQPQWSEHFNNTVSLESYYLTMIDNHQPIFLSYQLANQQWINYIELLPGYSYSAMAAVFLLLLTLLAAFLLYSWSVLRITLSLQNLKESATLLGIDFYRAPKVREFGPTLARETAHALNQMKQRIEQLLERRTRMLATISHDLRTPITRLKIRTQFLQNDTLLHHINSDLDEMETMIKSILAFARDEAGVEAQVKFDLNALFFAVCAEFMDMGHTINILSEPQRVVFVGRRLALKRAFQNILDNAVRYAKDISVVFQAHSDHVMIMVQDRGPGVPDAELPKVFKPYYRGQAGKKYSSVGTGLGLASVETIIRQHHGTVTLHNRPEVGLAVVIELPLSYHQEK